MPLQKETVTFNFSGGLDTLDDPNQIPLGKFTVLNNAIFIKANTGEVGALKKRNGFSPLPATVSTVSYLCNYNESLVGIGQGSIQQYSTSAQSWINRGYYQPLALKVQSIIKNSYSQSQQDSAIASNGIGCTAYSLGDAVNTYQYALFDSISGQIVNQPTILPVVSSSTYTFGQPKVFNLGSSFFIVYGVQSSGTSQLIATQVNNYYPFSSVQTGVISQSLYQLSKTDIISSVTTLSNGSMFDGIVASNSIILSYINAGINSLSGALISPSFSISSSLVAMGSYSCAAISTCFDPATSTIYTTLGSFTSITYFGTNYNFSPSFSPQLAVLSSASINFFSGALPPAQYLSNIGTIASGGSMRAYFEVGTFYSQLQATFPNGAFIRTSNIVTRPITSSGVVGSESFVNLNLGLASKPFFMNGATYLFATNQNNFQPTYYLINSTGSVISQFAYGNAGGYRYNGIPSVSVFGQSASISYLRRDLLESQNAGVISSSSTVNLISPFYSQTGINQGFFSFTSSSITAKQTGNVLSINGGFLWNYDGLQAFENNFFVFPTGPYTQIQQAIASTNSQLTIQNYQYQALFETMDGQGNTYRSSVGLGNTSYENVGSGASFFRVIGGLTVPTLGYRPPLNPTKVSIYRWSQAQPVYYKLGSFIYTGVPVIGTVSQTLVLTTGVFGSSIGYDSATFIDTTPDNSILGNEIIYTNGNVVEDSPAPSFISMDIWDERLWGISAEDGTLQFSKPLASQEPVEMNAADFSLYIPPNQTAQGTAQQPLCIAPMDEKQIIFCKSSVLFITGSGPDITGANSQYSEPIQIPSQVGCSNPNSIVSTPNGLMFQSDNGIWLLDRNLSVKYIGKEVEAYNNIPVTSATCIPGTNEVRFSLNTGTRLVYDLLADQWTTFSGISVQSGTVIQGLDTVLTSTGQVYQEVSGSYVDGTNPINMSFTTGWINLSGLQGYARAYWMQILGTFLSPHAYTVGIAYDYNPTIVQTASISPYNTVGSGSSVEQWQVNFKNDQCQSFQLTFNEISSGTAGAGLTISGISLTYGKKKTFARNIPAQNRIG